MSKKIIALVFALALAFSFSGDAYALQCKDGQSLNSDECWTEVKIGDGYLADLGLSEASRGNVVVVSVGGLAVGNNDGYLAELSTASTDQLVLGVIQQPIASGASGMVLARGRGFVRVVATIASADRLAVTEGAVLTSRAGLAVVADTANDVTSEIGIALEATTTDADVIAAYIDVL